MTVGETNQSRSAADLIKRDDALAAIDRALNNPKRYATGDLFGCYAAIRALPATDPAAIREAALREVLALRRLGQTCFDNIEVMKDGWLIHEDDVKALIGEKK